MAYVIGKSTQYFWMPSLAWRGHRSAPPPLSANIDYDAAAGHALEDLIRELRQVAERAQAVSRRGFGHITESMPSRLTPRSRNGITEVGRSLPPASPQAATLALYL